MKYIFLDEKYWIDLRRHLFSEPNALDLSAVVDILTEKINSGEWAFPLSLEHISETRATFNPALRQPLIATMLFISQGYTIKSFTVLKEHEIAELLNDRCAWTEPEKVIIQDPGNIFGVPAAERLDQFLEEEGISRDSSLYQKMHELYPSLQRLGIPLAQVMDQTCVLTTDKESGIKTLEALRANGESNELLFVFNRIRDYYSPEQQERILSFGLTKFTDKDKLTNKAILLDILQRLPTFYTNCVLMYKDIRMQPKNKPFHKNDFLDMMYLAAMIPYCDVVITESKWVDLAKQAHLDNLYNTVLLSELQGLLNV